MVGNDIVDLTAAEKEVNWRRKGFLEKIFTLKEQSCLTRFGDPGLMIWLLWSMKESAYKIFVQENHERIIAPLKFQCSIKGDIKSNIAGEVISGEKIYFTFSEISKNKISTTAYSGKIFRRNILSGDLEFSKAGYSSCSLEVIYSFISEVSEYLNLPAEDLSVKKDELNIPHLFYKDKYLKSSISFSHHGRYGSYSAEFL